MKNKINKFNEFRLNESLKYDTSNNSSFVLIEPGITLPSDFLIDNHALNRYKYVIQLGFMNADDWLDEYSLPPTVSIVAHNLLGSNRFKPVRYRLRTDEDEDFDPEKLEGREKAYYTPLLSATRKGFY